MTRNASSSIGRVRGVAIYLSAILGGGLLVMPSLTYRVAGPASVLAWLALLGLSVPVAWTFARLGAVLSDASGVGAFATEAFGARMGAAVSWWFVLALPFGAPATALVGAAYLERGLQLSPHGASVYAIAFVLLSCAAASALLGVRASGAIQVGLTACLGLTLAVAAVGSLPSADMSRLTPFAPHGVSGIAAAAGMLFFSFAGWEAVAPLARTFRDPSTDVPSVTRWTLAIVSVLYLALSLSTILAIGPGLLDTETPVSTLLTPVLGMFAAPVTGMLAGVLTFGAMTSYITGAGHMTAGLARDGWLPAPLAKGVTSGHTPRWPISLVAGASMLVLLIMQATRLDLTQVMTLAAAMFIAVTVAGLAAGSVLLPSRSGRHVAGAGAVLMTVVLAGCGWAALYPVAVLVVVVICPLPRRTPCPRTPSSVAPATSDAASSTASSPTGPTSP